MDNNVKDSIVTKYERSNIPIEFKDNKMYPFFTDVVVTDIERVMWRSYSFSVLRTYPSFFNFYLGGLLGMKAYPFYAVEGNEIAWIHLAYRFPLARDIDAKFGHLYLDKIFLSITYLSLGFNKIKCLFLSGVP